MAGLTFDNEKKNGVRPAQHLGAKSKDRDVHITYYLFLVVFFTFEQLTFAV